jgi:hypothetical protein
VDSEGEKVVEETKWIVNKLPPIGSWDFFSFSRHPGRLGTLTSARQIRAAFLGFFPTRRGKAGSSEAGDLRHVQFPPPTTTNGQLRRDCSSEHAFLQHFMELLVHADGVTGSDGACHELHLSLTAPVPVIPIDCLEQGKCRCLPLVPKAWQSSTSTQRPHPATTHHSMQYAMHIHHDATRLCASQQPSHSPSIPTTRSLSARV